MALLSGWSLQSDLWQELNDTLQGVKWQSTWLDSLFQDSVPPSPGIYMIHPGQHVLTDEYNLPRDISGVLYVGRSSNLRNRFKQHSAIHAPNPYLQTCGKIFGKLRFTCAPAFSSGQTSPYEWISTAEHVLISVLNPPANSNIPTGSKLVGKIGTAVPAT